MSLHGCASEGASREWRGIPGTLQATFKEGGMEAGSGQYGRRCDRDSERHGPSPASTNGNGGPQAVQWFVTGRLGRAEAHDRAEGLCRTAESNPNQIPSPFRAGEPMQHEALSMQPFRGGEALAYYTEIERVLREATRLFLGASGPAQPLSCKQHSWIQARGSARLGGGPMHADGTQSCQTGGSGLNARAAIMLCPRPLIGLAAAVGSDMQSSNLTVHAEAEFG